jgi:hypothetical protein
MRVMTAMAAKLTIVVDNARIVGPKLVSGELAIGGLSWREYTAILGLKAFPSQVKRYICTQKECEVHIKYEVSEEILFFP